MISDMDDGSGGSQCPEPKGIAHECKNDQRPADPEILWNLLLQMDPYKSMEPDGVHPRILKN